MLHDRLCQWTEFHKDKGIEARSVPIHTVNINDKNVHQGMSATHI